MKRKMAICIVGALAWVCGCAIISHEKLTIRSGAHIIYQCDNGDRVTVRYYSLSDGSLDFVKVVTPDGKEYTLPRAISASGARYTNDREFVWWNKGDSGFVEMRDPNGEWKIKYRNCQDTRNVDATVHLHDLIAAHIAAARAAEEE